MEFSKDEYELKYFIQNGFVRKQCKNCKRYFWTLNKDFEYCQSSPCVEYGFIGEKISNFNLNEVRNLFINYFKEKSHTEISYRPVVARWRDDIYLTIASIAVFQPFVTSGIVPPPANPLVFSQPCIRLKDIDLVGKTAGRHLTIFEMMAHHSFNTVYNTIYWKDETVEYCQDFSSKILNIDPLSICYIEDAWEGGGNAGPCFEVASKGLEIATLVFMKYQIVNGTLKDLPLFIVDTGYGLERYAWFISGKSSAFHAIYDKLLEKIFKKLGLDKEVNHISEIHSKKSLLYLQDKDPIFSISKELNTNEKEIREIIKRLEASYVLLDHSKCITFLLADGIVPSNVGEGYLGRLVIRKLLRIMKLLNIDITLEELIEDQISLLSKSFPHLVKEKDRIIEIVNIEREKYDQLLKRADTMIDNLIREKIKKNEKFNIDELINLYDSHGISPEYVVEKAAKYNIEISVPKDFLSKIVEKHEISVKKDIKKVDLPITKDLQPTYPLYYDNPYTDTFRAKVLKVIYPDWIILDKTAFYPEGGGQIYDTGKIIYNDFEMNVLSVYKFDNVIYHKVNKIISGIEGQEVIGKIDFNRRLDIMRHHTATHIMLYSLRKILGNHVWQAGAQKDEEKGRLDITHYKRINEEELKKIEQEANKIVLSNIPVKARFMDRKEAEEKYGYYIYQGGVPDGRFIRIVSVGDYDYQACGGTHVSTTGEVGIIKVIRTERIQDGIERIIYTAGFKSVEYFGKLEKEILLATNKLNVPTNKLLEGITKLLEENKKLKKLNEKLSLRIANEIYNNLKNKPYVLNKIKVYFGQFQSLGEKEMINIGELITKKESNSLAVLFSRLDNRVECFIFASQDLIKQKIYAYEIAKMISTYLKGKGGGDEKFARIVGTDEGGIKLAIEKIIEKFKFS